MNCPSCSRSNDKVIDSRSVKKGASIRRRRKCLSCDWRFTTYEQIEEMPHILRSDAVKIIRELADKLEL